MFDAFLDLTSVSQEPLPWDGDLDLRPTVPVVSCNESHSYLNIEAVITRVKPSRSTDVFEEWSHNVFVIVVIVGHQSRTNREAADKVIVAGDRFKIG